MVASHRALSKMEKSDPKKEEKLCRKGKCFISFFRKKNEPGREAPCQVISHHTIKI
jgi:hypothetical protein